ncbi:hypothetical protein AKJ18_34670, partial [Vibrio xuii]
MEGDGQVSPENDAAVSHASRYDRKKLFKRHKTQKCDKHERVLRREIEDDKYDPNHPPPRTDTEFEFLIVFVWVTSRQEQIRQRADKKDDDDR